MLQKTALKTFLCLVGIFGVVAFVSAELSSVEGDHKFEGIVNWFPNGISIGQQGSGGVTYFNGTIVNDTSTSLGDNPVTFGDEVRIDGRVFRGSVQGPESLSGDPLPFIIDDDFLLKGNLSFSENSIIDFSGTSITNFPATYTQAEIDTLLASKAAASSVYTKSDVYTKDEIHAAYNGKADQSSVYTKTEIDSNTYTQSQVDTLLAGKSDSSHNHDSSYVSQTNPSWNAVTTYISISPVDLNSADFSFATMSDRGYTISGGLSASTAYAPVSLPQGAVVTNFNVSYIDDSSSDVTFTLRRNSKDNTASSEMASITTSGENDSTVRTDEDTTISLATIDNSMYTYAIRVEMPAFTTGSSSFLGAYIEYSVDAFN